MKGLMLMVAAGLAAVCGALVGSVPTSAEVDGQAIMCGPALFHDWSRLPYLECAAVYEPWQTLAIVFFVGSVILMIVGGLALREPHPRVPASVG
jgi:hypothetical protein